VHGRVAIHLAGGGKEKTRTVCAREPECVLGATASGGQCFQRQAQIVRRRRRTREVCNSVDWTVDGNLNGHVRGEEVEQRIRQKMGDVVDPPGGQVVNADDRIPSLDQPFA
jgi:hypothetical protein